MATTNVSEWKHYLQQGNLAGIKERQLPAPDDLAIIYRTFHTAFVRRDTAFAQWLLEHTKRIDQLWRPPPPDAPPMPGLEDAQAFFDLFTMSHLSGFTWLVPMRGAVLLDACCSTPKNTRYLLVGAFRSARLDTVGWVLEHRREHLAVLEPIAPHEWRERTRNEMTRVLKLMLKNAFLQFDIVNVVTSLLHAEDGPFEVDVLRAHRAAAMVDYDMSGVLDGDWIPVSHAMRATSERYAAARRVCREFLPDPDKAVDFARVLHNRLADAHIKHAGNLALLVELTRAADYYLCEAWPYNFFASRGAPCEDDLARLVVLTYVNRAAWRDFVNSTHRPTVCDRYGTALDHAQEWRDVLTDAGLHDPELDAWCAAPTSRRDDDNSMDTSS